MKRVTIEEAQASADQWKAQREDQDRQPDAAYFSDASPHDLVRMWKSGKSTRGKKLTKYEFGCLVERWVEVFDGLPPSNEQDGSETNASPAASSTSLPEDDTMLRTSVVLRLTGLSMSTIRRMVDDGRFPQPLRIGERAKGWLARDVKSWIETLNVQRSSRRQ
jgi:prophage regulatory protein